MNSERYTAEQLKHQEEMKQKRLAIVERKARTRRLIIHGAVAESFIDNSENMSGEEFMAACNEAIYGEITVSNSSPQESHGSDPR